jgi:sarcosine oxidase subunit gamma
MTALLLEVDEQRSRLGLKGPGAADWLAARDIALPMAPNSWRHSGTAGDAQALLVARLGQLEFFIEGAVAGTAIKDLSKALETRPPAVYPVLREDWRFQLSGAGVHDVLAQVCNVQFAALALDSHPVIMTLMIGVAVLVVPQGPDAAGPDAERRYRIWCDPTFGPSLSENLEEVVVDCGGRVAVAP